MRNKKGFELGWQFFFNLIFIVSIIIIITLWIHGQASGKAFEKQLLAKEICILTTQARENTTITIEHKKTIIIEARNNTIIVKDGAFDKGYSYPCYKEVEISKKDNTTIISTK